MKRFYFWALSISLLLILAGVIWFFFFNTPAVPTVPGKPTGDLPAGGNRNIGGRGGNNSGGGGSANSTSSDPFAYISPLEKIWDKPVVGFTYAVVPILITSTSTNPSGQQIFVQTRSTSTYLFFVEKSTGNIFKKDFSTNKIIRVTNTTVPAVEDAVFLNSGKSVVLQTYNRDTKKVETFVADVPQTISENSPISLGAPTSLQDNIISFVPSYDGTSLYYLVPTGKGSTLYRYTKEKGAVFVESLPLKELFLKVTNKDVFAISKPSAFIPGYVFRVSPFVIVYGGKTGFSYLPSPLGGVGFVSMWSSSGLFSYVHSLVNGSDSVLDAQFLADKCSWSPLSTFLLCGYDVSQFIGDSGLPEAWYMGDVSFSDTLYLVNQEGGSYSAREAINLYQESNQDIDLIKPAFDSSSAYFSFINKKDGSLWLLDVVRTFSR